MRLKSIHLLSLFTALLLATQAISQPVYDRNANEAVLRFAAKIAFGLPKVCGTPANTNFGAYTGIKDRGAVVYDTCANRLLIWKGSGWLVFKDSTFSTGIYLTVGPCTDSVFSLPDSTFLFAVQRVNGLRSGTGVVTYTSGYNYNVSAAYYTLNCQDYNSRDTSLTLAAADPTYNRFDVIYVDTTGRARLRTGTPAANPVIPQIDELVEIALATIRVDAGTTSPAIGSRPVYNENNSGEWNSHTNSGGITVNYASTAQAASGTKSTEVTNITTKDNYLTFIRPGGDSLVSGFTTLQFKLRLKNYMRMQVIHAYFASGTTRVTAQVRVPFDGGAPNVWQTIVLNIADFNPTGPADRLYLRISANPIGTTADGFFVDDIQLLSGTVAPPPATNYVQNIRRNGDDVEQQKEGVFAKVFDLTDLLKKGDTSLMLNPYLRTAWFNGYFDTRFALKTTDNLAEGSTNQYYSNAKARAAVSLTFSTTGTSGAATGTYNSSTGQFTINIPQYQAAGSYLTSISGIAAGGDLGGTYPNPTVQGLKGYAVPTPTTGFLRWNGTAWEYNAGSGGGSITLGALNGLTKDAKGAGLSGSTLYMQTVGPAMPGILGTGNDTIAGVKMFNNYIDLSNIGGNAMRIDFYDSAKTKFSGIGYHSGGGPTGFSNMQFHIADEVSKAEKSFRWLIGNHGANGSGPSANDLMYLNASGFYVKPPFIGNFTFSPGNYIRWNGSLNSGQLALVLLDSGGTKFSGITMHGGGGVYRDMRFHIQDDIYGTPGGVFRWFVGNPNGSYYGAGASTDWMWLSNSGLRLNKPAVINDKLKVGGTTQLNWSLVDFQSTTGGVYFPRMTTAQAAALGYFNEALMLITNTDRSSLSIATEIGWGHGFAEIYGSKFVAATNADYTLDPTASFVTLPTLTANRILTLPSATTYYGKTIIIKVANSAAFTWTTSVALKDKNDADVTVLANDTVYTIFSNGSLWLITSIY